MRDRDAVRKTGAAAGILQIADIGWLGLGQFNHWGSHGREAFPVHRLHRLERLRSLRHHRQQAIGAEHHHWITAFQLGANLFDIAVTATKGGWQRQGHRPGTGVDDAEKQGGKIGAGLGNECNPVARFHTAGDQAVGGGAGVVPHFAERIDPGQRGAGVEEIEAAHAGCGIVQRVTERWEIGEFARQVVVHRGWCPRQFGADRLRQS